MSKNEYEMYFNLLDSNKSLKLMATSEKEIEQINHIDNLIYEKFETLNVK